MKMVQKKQIINLRPFASFSWPVEVRVQRTIQETTSFFLHTRQRERAPPSYLYKGV
jgi:hypothetical protein